MNDYKPKSNAREIDASGFEIFATDEQFPTLQQAQKIETCSACKGKGIETDHFRVPGICTNCGGFGKIQKQ